MPVSVLQNLEGAQNTGLATVTVTHSAATPGTTLILLVGADDYRTTAGGSRPESSGYALPTGGAQETFLGHYVWTKVASGGETSVQYTIGSASPSCWEFYEVSGLDGVSPIDISNGQLAASSGNTYTTPAVTPTAGDRWLFASMGGSLSSAFTDMNTWLNSFVELNDTFTTLASGTRDIIGAASLAVTANGSTAYSSGVTYAQTPQSRTGIIVAFKVATAAVAPAFPPSRLQNRREALPKLPRNKARISTPVRAQVNPPFPFTGVKQPRRLRGIWPRRGEAWLPVQPQVVVTAPKFPVPSVREHTKGLRLFRPRVATPVPTQTAPVAPAFPPRGLRARARGLRLFRPRAAPAPQWQDMPPAAAHARPRAQMRVRGHVTLPPPPQAVVNAPAYPPRPVRARLKGLRLGRGHVSVPTPAQITPVPPAYPPRLVRTRLRGLKLFRGRSVAPVPAQAAVAFVSRGVRTRLRSRWLRGRTSTPVAPQVLVVAPKQVPLFARVKQHAIRLARGKFRTPQVPGVRALPMANSSPLPPIATVSEQHPIQTSTGGPIQTVTGDRRITTFSPPPAIETASPPPSIDT